MTEDEITEMVKRIREFRLRNGDVTLGFLEDTIRAADVIESLRASLSNAELRAEEAESRATFFESELGGRGVKLFIWNEAYPVSYGSACVFALGSTLENARETAKCARLWRYGIGTPGKEIGHQPAFDGEPTLVLDAGAVCYEWSE
jgi:hypothetical protein